MTNCIWMKLTYDDAGTLLNLLERTINDNNVSMENEPDKKIRQAIESENDNLIDIRTKIYRKVKLMEAD